MYDLLFSRAAGDAMRKKIRVDNPAELFGF